MSGSRSVRTRPRNGLAISDLLTTALLSELCQPSPELWIVSGWVTDIPVLDNRHRQYDAVLGGIARSSLLFTEILAELVERGCELYVAVREVDHNEQFVRRLEDRVRADQVQFFKSPDLHEKIMVGRDWAMKGSMNFTWNGLQQNEENIDFVVDSAAAAKERLELRTRWIGAA
jgi:hypothetical protein